ncbi:MAG: polysaccharide pyruvyl transferase family protein [Bacteroidales bacterium]|nr:polysaccharide pyruvyl transferase family protein [Bacteroidales bacterium]
MKKIGILTFHRSINYGAFMQAYALSHEIMKRYGPIVEIIDFEIEYKNAHYKEPLYRILGAKEYYQKYKRFRSDLNLLPLSPETLITNDYSKLLNYISKRYDIVITGSDAVWAYQKMEVENPYWLFGDNLQCAKLSYAASAYSTDFAKVTEEEKSYIGQALKSFNYIGVRDQETHNFIQSIDSSLIINRNCDPTVLLRKPEKDYASYLLQREKIDIKKPIVGIMAGAIDYMPKIQQHLGPGYQYVNLYLRNRLKDKYNPFLKNHFYNNLSPFEWYNLYAGLHLNFTNYFHGTLLGLKGGVPTFSFDNTNFKYDYVGKIKQVLNDLNLSDFCFEYNRMSKQDEERLFSQIDFAVKNRDQISQTIDENMEVERQKSNSFFKALEAQL